MEQKESTSVKRTTHHGHAIRRLRLDRRLSQKELGDKVSMVQQTVSHYEDEEKIDDLILKRFAKALDVSVDFIKELEEEKPMTFYVENNQVTDHSSAYTNLGSGIDQHVTNNQLDKEVVKTVLDDLKNIYEGNMKHFQECMDLTRAEISKLEQTLSKLEGEGKKE